ncbi:unnamed protein product [Gadus morhua 'NCC']
MEAGGMSFRPPPPGGDDQITAQTGGDSWTQKKTKRQATAGRLFPSVMSDVSRRRVLFLLPGAGMIEEGGSFLVPDKNQPSLTVRDAREIEEKRDNNIQNPRRTLEVVEAHRRTQALPWSLPNSHRKSPLLNPGQRRNQLL